MQTALPDPVFIVQTALGALGLAVTDVVSDSESHRITVCSCPIPESVATLPEVVRGTVRGAAEEALGALADTFGIGYLVQATTPDDCTVALRLTERPLLASGR